MYELRTAISYLLPRKGQLSVSVVGLIAVLVIQAIAWLILVFFSTTEGLETRWSQKISGVLGSMRTVPTFAYFESPEAQIDTHSSLSSGLLRRLSLKDREPKSRYDDSVDAPLSKSLAEWNTAHGSEPSSIAQFTKKLTDNNIPWRPYESTICHFVLPDLTASHRSLSQYTCVLGVPSIPLNNLALVSEMTGSEAEKVVQMLSSPHAQPILNDILAAIDRMDLIVSTPFSPQKGGEPIPIGTRLSGVLDGSHLMITLPSGKRVSYTPEGTSLPFAILKVSLKSAPIALRDHTSMAFVPELGYPVLLSKHMRSQGARLLEKGTFEFSSSGFGGAQSLTLPVYVAGFFDSGILPIGGKLVISSIQAVTTMQPGWVDEGPISPSGIMIDLPVSKATVEMQQSLQRLVPSNFFSVLRYDQYEVTQELYQQLESEKTLFRLISIIIIAVACSNIFSMLFILAHDRRKEIAVLRALGSSKKSIASIFILAGLGVGFAGSLIGSLLAVITLHYLPELLSLLSNLQGHELLQQSFYGEIASQQLQAPPVIFTLVSISLLSAAAGCLAAIRACRVNVSEALKS